MHNVIGLGVIVLALVNVTSCITEESRSTPAMDPVIPLKRNVTI